jgi:hypothetical protein
LSPITARSVAYIGDEIAECDPAISHRKGVMCERCIEIDIKIERYSRMAKMINDKTALQAIDTLVAGLEAQKLALHPNPDG